MLSLCVLFVLATAYGVIAAPRVALETGVELRYVEAGAETAPPLILLHGLGDTKRSWSPILSDLAKTHRVYALDQRGHGESSAPACCYTTAELADDVVAFMDAMKIDRAAVAGHSLGSFVAQTLVTRHPKRVSRLILIGSADTGIGNENFEWLQGEVAKFGERPPDDFVDLWQSNVLPVDAAFVAQVKKETGDVRPAVWKAFAPVLLTHDRRRELAEVKVPVLILAGEKDPLFPPDQQQRLRALLPHAQFREYAGAGHNTHWELPQLVARDMAAFLRD
jgi:pimeloyl-ACP methyl ester carboxylesterase